MSSLVGKRLHFLFSQSVVRGKVVVDWQRVGPGNATQTDVHFPSREGLEWGVFGDAMRGCPVLAEEVRQLGPPVLAFCCRGVDELRERSHETLDLTVGFWP